MLTPFKNNDLHYLFFYLHGNYTFPRPPLYLSLRYKHCLMPTLHLLATKSPVGDVPETNISRGLALCLPLQKKAMT